MYLVKKVIILILILFTQNLYCEVPINVTHHSYEYSYEQSNISYEYSQEINYTDENYQYNSDEDYLLDYNSQYLKDNATNVTVTSTTAEPLQLIKKLNESETANFTTIQPNVESTVKDTESTKFNVTITQDPDKDVEDYIITEKQNTENDESVTNSDIYQIKVDEDIIESENYPNPYPAGMFESKLIIAGGAGVEIKIEEMDLDNTQDFLLIRAGFDDEDHEKGRIYTGKHKNEIIRILHTNHLYLRFVSRQTTSDHAFKGYRLIVSPFGKIPDPIEPPVTEFPIHDLPLEYIGKNIRIEAERRNNVTWNNLRLAITEMANLYIKSNNMTETVEFAKPEYVVFRSIHECPGSWKNSEVCIHIDFAVPVPLIDNFDDDLNNEDTRVTYELTSYHLEAMWEEYSQQVLDQYDIQHFNNNNLELILIWFGISAGIIIFFLLMLVGIWKMEVFQDYRRMSNGNFDDLAKEIKEPQDIDVTSIPNPYQNVPILFPSHTAYTPSVPGASAKEYTDFAPSTNLIENPREDEVEIRQNETFSNMRKKKGVSFHQPNDNFSISSEPQESILRTRPSIRLNFDGSKGETNT